MTLEDFFCLSKKIRRRPKWNPNSDTLRFEFTSVLEIGGVVVGGLELRAKAHKTELGRDVCFQLEYSPGSRTRTLLARIDWRPFHSHGNDACSDPLISLDIIQGSHFHDFTINYIKHEDRMKRKLSLATRIDPDPRNFTELLAFSANALKIENMDVIAPPEWSPDLFRV